MAHKYTIAPSPDGKYIILKIIGYINRNLAMQYNLESHALGQELGIDKYLVDVTESKNIDTLIDSSEFVHKDMQDTPGINKLARVAVLVSPGDHSHDFIETQAKRAGLDVTLFTNQENALHHLLQD